MDKLRSVSVPRKHFYQNGYGNPITPDNQSPMNFNRGVSTQDLHNNKSALINREVIKTEGNVDIRDDLYEKYKSLGSPYSNSRGTLYKQRPSGSWGEFILKQGEAAQAVNNNYRAEDKMRAMKYREALDMMIQEGKHKKNEMRNQSRQPTHDHVQLQELLKMEKARELEEKRHYNSELQRIQREKEDLRRQEQLQREQELMEQRRLNEKMHEFDQIAQMQGKFVKQQTLNEYQAHINMKKQNMQLEKQREEIESPGPNQFFAKQDEERRKLYERIKDQANADRHKPIYFIEKEYQKFRQLEDFVNKSVQDKIEKDTLEMMRRNEAFKRAQMDALQNNRNQAVEKSMKQRADKRHEQEEFGMSLEQKKMVDHIEYLKREQDLNEKRNYYETLKNQANERQEAKHRENAMTNAERILNFRKTKSPEGFVDDVSMNSLPMNARSHERSRQLKYIDNWLNNTAVNHQRMKQQ